MLRSIAENYQNLVLKGENNKTVEDLISGIEENLLKELISLLKPFHSLRTTLCRDTSPTFHLVLPTKQKLLKFCANTINDSEVIEKVLKVFIVRFQLINKIFQLKGKLSQNINKYYKLNDLHFVATMLFPSCKHLNNLATNEEKLKTKQLLNDMSDRISLQNEITTTITEINNTLEIDDCLMDFIDIPSHENNLNSSQNEIEEYLNYYFNYDPSAQDILNFWQANKKKFPRLYLNAKELLSIPASNTSSERNFSFAGLTLTDRRSYLDPLKVDKLLFIRSNYDLYK
jgi:hypothetical protein